MVEQRIRVPGSYRSLGSVRRAIVRFAAPWFTSDCLADIEYAVGEALANAAEHGNGSGRLIDVYARCDGERLILEIRDGGRGFARANSAGHAQPGSNAPRGYGIYIMRQLMDGVEYADHGRCLRLTKIVDGGTEPRN